MNEEQMGDSAGLALTPERMRTLGYRVVDMLVRHHTRLSGKRVTGTADRATMESLLREPMPRSATDFERVLARVERDVFTHTMYADHPRFFAFVPGPSNFVSVLGDLMASGFNAINALWLESAGPAELELVTVDWLRELCGLPAAAGGLFVSGGTVANLTGLATARCVALGDRTDEAVVYCTGQTHASVLKGLRLLGLGDGHVSRVPVDDRYRLVPDALRKQIRTDRRDGRRPFCVVANAGTTNTGAVDPLPAIGEICDEERVWLHVDGAYGAAAMLTEEGSELLAGIERADSLAVDPHKWLFQPFEIGCVLVRDRRWLRAAFGARHEYMQDADLEDDTSEINFCDHGLQLTRGLRALKLWLSLQVFGADAFTHAVERGLEQARVAERIIREYVCFEIVTPAQLGVVSFVYRPQPDANAAADEVNRRIVTGCVHDGYAMVSSTVLDGATVLRLCTINPRTTEGDIRSTVALLARLGRAAERD